MKYLDKYNEYASYLKLHDDDDYDIEEVKQDKNHEYKYCDGVLYELSGRDDRVVDIIDVENTEGNMFYEDQIERYMEYIEDGGIIQTFPVDSSKKADNLEDMLAYLDDEKDGFDIVYSLFKGNTWDKTSNTQNEKMYELYMAKGGYWNITTEPELYGFDEELLDLKDSLKSIYNIEDLHKVYHEFEEPNKDKFDDVEDYEEAMTEWEEKSNLYDEDILRGMEDIIKYFEDEEEYSLTDFNHRFEALKRLGKTRIYVEVM
jgi:hypothetical protein